MPNQLFTNNAFGALAGSITSAATTLALVAGNGARFPAPTSGDYFMATLVGLDTNGNENVWEIIKVTARTTDTFGTIVRAQEGTSAAAWGSGARIEIRDTASSKTDPKVATLTVAGAAQSGTNTGDQTITLTGDVAGSGSGSFSATIQAGAVTLAKMANVVTSILLGRSTAGTGAPEVLSAATARTLLSVDQVNNTSDANKPVSTAQAAADTTTLNSAKTYADGLVVGLWDDRGNFDASPNTFPAAGGSGSAGAVLKGDIWTVSVAGTLGGVPVAPRQTIRAMIDAPGQTAANWALGLANTDLDDSISDGVTGRAPSQNAVFDALALKQDTSGRDASGGFAGLTLFKINFKNAQNTFTSFFTNANTAARTYTFQDRSGTIADDTDLAGKASLSGAAFTGNVSVAGRTNVTNQVGKKVALTASTATTTLDLSTADTFKVTIAANTTFAFTNPPAGTDVFAFSIITVNDATAGRTMAWPASISKYAGGFNPPRTTAASAYDMWSVYTEDAGSTYVISLAMADVK